LIDQGGFLEKLVLLTRRGFFAGLAASALAAPAIIRTPGLLMPVKRIVPIYSVIRTSLPIGTWRMFNQGVPLTESGVQGLDAYAVYNEIMDDLSWVKVE
jgi:hypothetical protein